MDQNVTITDINIPFGRMVMIIMKWSLATIPAAILLGILYMLLGGMIAGCSMMTM